MNADKLSDLARLCRGRKILVIDDEKFSRAIVLRHLKDAGVEAVVQAASATEALQALMATPSDYCATICDFNMPVLTGLHFLKAVRTGFEGIANSLPVIMVTGFADSSLVGAALRLDVDAFVVKPVSRATLENRLRHALSVASAVSSPDAYAAIDVDRLVQAVLKPQAAAKQPVAAPVKEELAGTEMAIGLVTEGMILAVDLIAPSGELLLGAGFRLSGRIVGRLKELAEMGIVPTAIRVR